MANFTWPAHFDADKMSEKGIAMFAISESSDITFANMADVGGDSQIPAGETGPTDGGHQPAPCCDWPFPEPRPVLFEGAFWWPWDGEAWSVNEWSMIRYGKGEFTDVADRPCLFKL